MTNNGRFEIIVYSAFAISVSGIVVSIFDGGANNVSSVNFYSALISGIISFIIYNTKEKENSELNSEPNKTTKPEKIGVNDLNLIDKKSHFKESFFLLDKNTRLKILSSWLLAKHDNPMIDEGILYYLEYHFDCILTDSISENMIILSTGEIDHNHIYFLERSIIKYINDNIIDEIEFDRLYFIFLTLKSNCNPIKYQDFLKKSYSKWTKNNSNSVIPMKYILLKAYNDVLVLTGNYDEVIKLYYSNLNELEQKYDAAYNCLKYQITESILSLYKKGLMTSNYDIQEIVSKNKLYANQCNS